MTGEEGTALLNFIGSFLRDNKGNFLNMWLSDPFLGMTQKRLNDIAEADAKEKEEVAKEIEGLKKEIEQLNSTITYLTAEPKEVIPEKVKQNKPVKKCVSEETVDEVMKEVKKK